MEKMQRMVVGESAELVEMLPHQLGAYVTFRSVLTRLEWERKRAKWYAEMLEDVWAKMEGYRNTKKNRWRVETNLLLS